MSRIHVVALIAVSALAAPTSIALAQVIFGPGMSGPDGTGPLAGSSTPGRVGRGEMCAGTSGGSRVRPNCEPDAPATIAEIERELTASAELGALLNEPQCEATTLTEYVQRNTMARVDGRISVANCPAGTTGTYAVVARVRDESGEIKPLEFSESWQRDDGEDVSFSADYPIGDNVDLLSVRVRDLRCTCADAANEASAITPEPPSTQQ